MSYQAGDVANGHVLGTDGTWHPINSATATMERPAIPAPAPTPATKKPFYRRWWFIGGAGITVAVIAISAASGGSSSPSGSTSDPAAAAAAAAPAPAAPAAPAPAPAAPAADAGLNTPVRDGAFEFTVTGVKCGVSQIGDKYLNTTPQGQFCLVSVNVTNIGNEPQMFLGSNQKAVDEQGRTLEADSGAVIYLPDSKSFLENINPGNTVKGTIAYDIPKTSKLAQLELHDSMFSGGATVKVA